MRTWVLLGSVGYPVMRRKASSDASGHLEARVALQVARTAAYRAPWRGPAMSQMTRLRPT